MAKFRKWKRRKGAKPKKPLTAFHIFSRDMKMAIRDTNPEFSKGEVLEELGKQWREMSEEDKEPYILQYDEARRKYLEELHKFHTTAR